jgi:Holliday junction DNA helicase RuvB
MSNTVEELDPQNKSNSENILRPTSFNHYVGQEKLKKQLITYIKAAHILEKDHIDHVLVSGPPGLGKTTIAHIIANEMKTNIHTAIAPAIEKPADMVALLVSLEDGDILFIDEIHALKRTTEEMLYSAMEDYKVDILTEDGLLKKTITLPLAKFTLIGATTRQGLMSPPLLDRFGIKQSLDYYSPEELNRILKANSEKLNINYEEDGLVEIANRSRGTPRIANNLLNRVRDFAVVDNDGLLNKDIAITTLDELGVDKIGLDERDRKVINVMYDHFKNRPVGIDSISKTVGEDKETIERIVEPFLLKERLIIRTHKGRELTKAGEEYAYRLQGLIDK